MSFDERFELLPLIRDDGVQTFAARERDTGRELLAHLFVNPRAPINRALLGKLDRLPEQERLRIVDRGVKDGTPYVVTGSLDEYGGLREWLVAKGKSAPPPAPPPAESARLDSAEASRIVTQAPPPPVPSPAAQPAPPPLAQPVTGPSPDDRFASLLEAPPEHPLPPPVMIAAPEPSEYDTTTAKLPAASPAPPSLLPPPLPQPAPENAGLQRVGEFAPPPLPPPPLPLPPLPPPPLFPPPAELAPAVVRSTSLPLILGLCGLLLLAVIAVFLFVISRIT